MIKQDIERIEYKMTQEFVKWHRTQLANLLYYMQQKYPHTLEFIIDEYDEVQKGN